ncbi:class I SAM-dependent methyltransferase [Catenovulum sediminis]|uniref:Methyltransferase domain-containing protein n=1 Tax=Catenovulum sediminis TaxID=1740262 RepID=A0ABV1RLE0_9ALTE|nr:methyltransferase domain-containing protein [Catenovulum sediminis]
MTTARVRYQTVEFDNYDIHLRTLFDNQQYDDSKGEAEALGISSASWPLFGIVWPSGLVLAHYLSDYQVENKRILEVGCGIGLSSLLLNARHANVTATDYHPEAGRFLAENVRLNKGQSIPFTRVDWNDGETVLGQFDMIVGSDLLYEAEHIALLSDFIAAHAKPQCEVILVDPGRGQQSRFSKKMMAYGFACQQSVPVHTDFLEKPFKGRIWKFNRAA